MMVGCNVSNYTLGYRTHNNKRPNGQKKRPHRGSNTGPHDLQSYALPLSYRVVESNIGSYKQDLQNNSTHHLASSNVQQHHLSSSARTNTSGVRVQVCCSTLYNVHFYDLRDSGNSDLIWDTIQPEVTLTRAQASSIKFYSQRFGPPTK